MVTTIGRLEPGAVVCRMIAMASSASPRFADRVVVQGSKVSRVADHVALLRDLAAPSPQEALQQFDLDDAGFLEVAKAWGAALDADPALAADVAAGLAKR